MSSSERLRPMVAQLRAQWDNEGEAARIAKQIILEGPEGCDALVHVLAEASTRYPKLAVGILNGFNESMNPYAEQQLTAVLNRGVLSDDDAAYLLRILGKTEPEDPEYRKSLVRRLRSTKDVVARAEILGEIVRLRVIEARELLVQMASQVDPDRLDYGKNQDWAAREEAIGFAIMALDGRVGELEAIAFSSRENAIRRSWALGFAFDALGEQSEPLLRRAVRDTERLLRVTAIDTIAERGSTELMELVLTSLDDPDPWVVHHACYAIRDLAKRPDFSEDLDAVNSVRGRLDVAIGKWVSSTDEKGRTLVVNCLAYVSSLLSKLAEGT